MIRSVAIAVLAAVVLVACEEAAPPGPPTSKVLIRNDSSTKASVRVKFWTKDYTSVPAGESAEVVFVNKDKIPAVQVEAKSSQQWDECWITMNVGQTLVVYDAPERIACRVE